MAELKNECSPNRKFKTGDWVCFNHGEYPEYFSREIWQITHWNYQYEKEGAPMGKHHKDPGMAHAQQHLRHAHPKEIEYHKSGLPFIYNHNKKKDELVEIMGEDFKIGDLIDTSKIQNFTGKQIITLLLNTDFVNEKAREQLSSIFEKL